METYNYPIVIEPDTNDTLLVSVPDIPEAHTFGEDEAEARVRAIEAIEAAIGALMSLGRDIAPPSPAAGRPTVTCRRSPPPSSPSTGHSAKPAPRRPNSPAVSAGTALRSAACSMSSAAPAWTTSSAPWPSSATPRCPRPQRRVRLARIRRRCPDVAQIAQMRRFPTS